VAEPPADAEAWQDALARTVGRRVARYRRARGLTAQQLSDELRATLGFDMKRAVIGNLETGLRRGVGIAEIFALAHILRVPPLLLVVPVGDDDFPMLPVVTTDPWSAARWVTGEGEPEFLARTGPADLLQAYRDEVSFLGLYRRHDTEVARWRRAARMAGSADGPVSAGLGEIEDGLRALRWTIRELGSTPPPLPRRLRHLDAADGTAD